MVLTSFTPSMTMTITIATTRVLSAGMVVCLGNNVLGRNAVWT